MFRGDAAPAANSASSGTEGDVLSMLQQGRRIDAIRMYREQTGATFPEAANAVDLLERVEKSPAARKPMASADVASDLKADLWALLQNGQKIEAVRLYRERTGGTLRKAGEAIEALAREHGVSAKAGCLGMLLSWLVVPGLLHG